MTEPVDEYLEAAVQRLLVEHHALAEQGLTVRCREQRLTLHGEVESQRRRTEILRLVRQHFPDVEVHADIGVTRARPPDGAEDLL
jgi:hypothetical protein